jgi:hypothetical protein
MGYSASACRGSGNAPAQRRSLEEQCGQRDQHDQREIEQRKTQHQIEAWQHAVWLERDIAYSCYWIRTQSSDGNLDIKMNNSYYIS